MRNYYSIFNDVLGPIMTGPSSSHTAACARIGKMTRILYGKDIKKVDIVFEEKGSYPSTYRGQGSDYGFVGGFLGYFPEDERLKDSLKIALENNIEINFKTEDLGMNHPNEAEIRIYENEKLEMTVLTHSIGGGMFNIVKLDGFDVFITGEIKKVFLKTEDIYLKNELIEILNKEDYNIQEKDEIIFFEIIIKSEEIYKKIEIFKNDKRVKMFRLAEVILPVERNKKNGIFFNAQEALEYNKDRGMKLWELAIAYECSIGKISYNEVIEKMRTILDYMNKSTISVNSNEKLKILSNDFYNIEKNYKEKKIIDIEIFNEISITAMKVMENNCKHNIVVAAPTAGSCGVIPAIILSCGKKVEANEMKLIKALLCIGLIGVFIANQGTFSAEVAGCQAENGAASCMAAAGVVELLDGNIEEAFSASSLALQNLLGLICDPIGGLTEIPCISRNVLAATNAVISTNMVMCGYESIIPLDETINSMFETGKLLPSELRCTCKGGLCNTKTGKNIYKNQSKQK